MKSIKSKAHYQATKDSITAAFTGIERAAYRRGDDAGWRRGFRVGAGLVSAVALVIVAATVIISAVVS